MQTKQQQGLESVKNQMCDISKGSGVSTSIAAFKTIRDSLGSRQIECLFEFKHMGSQGATARNIADIIGADLNCMSGRVTELRQLGAIEKTGMIHEKAKMHRITREGINILQAR